MITKKPTMSHFSTCVEQLKNNTSSGEYHLIDNEYFAAFNTVNDIQQFHNKLIEKQSINDDRDDDLQTEHDHNEMDMKTFAEQFLIDSPESKSKEDKNLLEMSNSSLNQQPCKQITVNPHSETNTKRQRRNVKDSPQSSHYLFTTDDDNNDNIFNSLIEKPSTRINRIAYEDISSILLTLDVKQSKKTKPSSKTKVQEPTIGIGLGALSLVKNEPIEHEKVCSMRFNKNKVFILYFSFSLLIWTKPQKNQLKLAYA